MAEACLEVFGVRNGYYQIAAVLRRCRISPRACLKRGPLFALEIRGRRPDSGNALVRPSLFSLQENAKGDRPLLELIIIVLLVLWLLGLFGRRGGNFIHLLLVVALILILVRFLR
jgi:hypothetical protein